MDIKSLNEQVRQTSIRSDLRKTLKNPPVIYDLFRPTIITNQRGLNKYTVKREEEMRIDLLFQNIYEISSDLISNYLEDVDILLNINNIDNPLNIKEGMLILYPELGKLQNYRVQENDSRSAKLSTTKKLGYPNKITKQDKSRKDYVDNNYSLPPTINSKPIQAVRYDSGSSKLSIGGI
jgi:hypothetical protein